MCIASTGILKTQTAKELAARTPELECERTLRRRWYHDRETGFWDVADGDYRS